MDNNEESNERGSLSFRVKEATSRPHAGDLSFDLELAVTFEDGGGVGFEVPECLLSHILQPLREYAADSKTVMTLGLWSPKAEISLRNLPSGLIGVSVLPSREEVGYVKLNSDEDLVNVSELLDRLQEQLRSFSQSAEDYWSLAGSDRRRFLSSLKLEKSTSITGYVFFELQPIGFYTTQKGLLEALLDFAEQVKPLIEKMPPPTNKLKSEMTAILTLVGGGTNRDGPRD